MSDFASLGNASVADAYLALLRDRGVTMLFGNAGTDFAPLIEAYAWAGETHAPVPRPILAAHENLAVSMAHGFALVSGTVPAVMVHVSVGTANMIAAAMNAARENVALLLTAGRTPLTEAGRAGSRDGYIHWAQEMYDQAGMLREIVKWDYELRAADQLAPVVDRALAIAASEPAGPVYLTLPREVLGEAAPAAPPRPGRQAPARASAPDRGSIETAAERLAEARRPLIVTANAGRDAAAFAALSDFAEQQSIPVVQHKPRYLSLPSSHPMHAGYDPARLVPEADAILVLESDVPWIPAHAAPAAGCTVIQAARDPLYRHIPIRGFPSDVTIAAGAAATIDALAAALDGRTDAGTLAGRVRWVEADRASRRAALDGALAGSRTEGAITRAFLSRSLSQAIGPEGIIFNEYPLDLDHMTIEVHGRYFGSSSASGLGWAPGAALGAKLAAPEALVVAAVGDGAYMFANPAAVHHAAVLHDLPILTVVANNAAWHAVTRSTLAMYPAGRVAGGAAGPFMALDALPPFEDYASLSGGFGERVETADALPGAVKRALHAVREERRPALLNVICET